MYNDGVKNFFIKPNDIIEVHWKKGFVEGSYDRKPPSTKGNIWWNDGIKRFSIPTDVQPESHWVRGMGKIK